MNRETTIVVIEDDHHIADLLDAYLRNDGFRVLLHGDGTSGLDRIASDQPALAIVDVGLPGAIDGFEVCRRVRQDHPNTAVLMLTARDTEVDRVLGLELGADDYVTKPFSPRELVARVRARLRRAGAGPAASVASADPWITRGAFAIDREGHRIRYRQQLLDLTRYEYAVLDALLQRPGAILSRAQLMDRGWDSDADSADRTVDTHVKTLRAKLRAAGADPDPIRTHRGLGYAVEA